LRDGRWHNVRHHSNLPRVRNHVFHFSVLQIIFGLLTISEESKENDSARRRQSYLTNTVGVSFEVSVALQLRMSECRGKWPRDIGIQLPINTASGNTSRKTKYSDML
jgi:hypothetical protein